ncbi:MAG: hypothetical protein V9E82_14065 [Candidatus Nanopelagicales bacterium]
MSRLRHWAWRVPLIVAIVLFLAGAVVIAFGNKYVSDILVGAGFAVGMLAVPLWILIAPREEAS